MFVSNSRDNLASVHGGANPAKDVPSSNDVAERSRSAAETTRGGALPARKRAATARVRRLRAAKAKTNARTSPKRTAKEREQIRKNTNRESARLQQQREDCTIKGGRNEGRFRGPLTGRDNWASDDRKNGSARSSINSDLYIGGNNNTAIPENKTRPVKTRYGMHVPTRALRHTHQLL